MAALYAVTIGILTACGIYLLLRERIFTVVLGLTLLSYAVSLFLLGMGRLSIGQPPVIVPGASYADPLPQALVLTAIVIAFGMTAFAVVLALRSLGLAGSDHVDAVGMPESATLPDPDGDDESRERRP
ncbi:Na+/H+ antiporter subunit C [Cupriavidus oxalaticus]|uniref:K(+)/H(+) antiporter subunit C n=1 Tax=Cupriavidus oxalaticus TaxID=96344 RepID=A0A375FYK2_9BURK|nr:Na+/H+ antiporter subunit C [Cupriavidus oxalaticus]QRQ88978.1 Na+/H+ antiporter subunit C [Cupriavidus oxalaticus]QRQ92696.1 Na+/H+ antiporter subunit C [Cupriavidus oxalaticus]WQD81299.1 Na+/H+ antiporter subunit C [Cupriavidus oxalaticus]SPC06426.1 Multisubunit Na+/H+ antiporter, MnhC subunit [Cupriavidus oxalaticus]SPC12591.1 putative K(+)/H(+) antiporter subunit C [Cupriavidus oxalaticus]